MYKSFAITVRPRNGISDTTVESLKKWLSNSEFSVGVLEKDNEARHLHAQIWHSEPKRKGDIAKAIQRICERTVEDWDNAQLKVLRSGIKIAYSDWYLDYLLDNDSKSEEELNCIVINNPPDKTMEYYPTEEEQEKVRSISNAVDPRFADMEVKLLEYLGDSPITLNSVAQFLAVSMFQERTMKVTIQQRDRLSLCKSLYAYASKSTDINLFIPEDKQFEKTKQMVAAWNSQDNADPLGEI